MRDKIGFNAGAREFASSLLLLLLFTAVDGWLVNNGAPSPRLFLRLRNGRGATNQGPRWSCQMNPLEKISGTTLGSMGSVFDNSEAFHEQRIKFHEERMRHHEERLVYHRTQLSTKKTTRMNMHDGALEEQLRRKAVASGRAMQILFVDLSNTCRSPAAEAMMRLLIQKAALQDEIIVRSCSTGAGTRDWFKEDVASNIEAQRVDPRMVTHASKRGLINLAGRQSMQLTKTELTSADLIIIMDKDNRKEVQAAAAHWGVPNALSKVRLLTEYCRSGTITTDIPDPYYGGRMGQASGQVFEKVLDLLEDGCKGLLRDCAPDSV